MQGADMLFAAAMPKEEIGALAFLKVLRARAYMFLYIRISQLELYTFCSNSQRVMDVE